MAQVLTPELVLNKSKCENLYQVKNLNLWGHNLESMQILKNLPNLEVLSLTVNKISTLEDFQYCGNLKELYLRKNSIRNITEILYLSKLTNLKVLWLQENPCSDVDRYRQIVIKVLPNLEKLDNAHITQEERQQAAQIQLNWDLSKLQQNNGLEENKNILNNNNNGNMQNQQQQQKMNEKMNNIPQNSFGKFNSNNNSESKQKENISINKHQQSVNEQLMQEQNANYQRDIKYMNDNMLCATMALIKGLDNNSLEIVKREIEKRIQINNNNNN